VPERIRGLMSPRPWQKGISAKRLVLLDLGGAPYAFDEGAAKAQYMKNSDVLQLDFASEADSGTGPS
jgi:hypothetical protein